MPYWGGVLLSAGVILFYTAVGGYLAVVWTSFAQAIVMLAALVLLAAVTVARVGGLASLADRLHALDPGLVSSPGVWGWSGLLSFSFIVSLGTWGMPQLIIRFYSIRNTRMLRVGIVVVTLGAAMALSPYLCGAAARILVPSVANPDLAIPALTDLVLNDWGGALFLAGVIAAGMSTFAGVLIIISSSLVRDVWIEGLGRSLSPSSEVRTNRILSLGVGVASLLIALRPPALILVLTAFAWAVIASTNLWPLLFGLYCRRTSPRAAVASMAAGASVAFLWQILIKRLPASWRGIHGFVVGLAIGLLVIGLGTLFGRPAPREAVRRAWGEEA
jgi:Na+/pantothenate symporter